uniref:uncharacterized protein LOC105351732 n=1 Tax=Fragaria vesca subsp. vesca TaxID=101020 RepID=UPI0005C90103|nr:PREDICTED: uncharacterized protein LOC105351732 [Fragaria vesca subsp. vesca]
MKPIEQPQKGLHTEISGLTIHAKPQPQAHIGNSILVPSQNQYQSRNQGYQHNQSYTQIICHYCKETGHIKSNCPRLQKSNYNPGWRGGNIGGRGGRGGSQRGKAAVQLVPEPDSMALKGKTLHRVMFPRLRKHENLCTRVIIGKGDLRGRLFHLDYMYAEPTQAPAQPLALTLNSDRLSELWLWHRRLGHPSFGVMKKSMPSLFLGIHESILHCETCALAKSHRSSYPLSFHSSTMPFELIHSDVWGPSKYSTLSGMRYFVPTDRTKHVEVDRHFIKEKLDGHVIFFPYVPTEEQLADILTKALSSKAFRDSLDKLGICDLYAPT